MVLGAFVVAGCVVGAAVVVGAALVSGALVVGVGVVGAAVVAGSAGFKMRRLNSSQSGSSEGTTSFSVSGVTFGSNSLVERITSCVTSFAL